MATVTLIHLESNLNIDGGALAGLSDGDDLQVTSASSTSIEATNPFNNHSFEIFGSSLGLGDNGLNGTVTGFAFYTPDGKVITRVSDINISGETFSLIIDGLINENDEDALVATLDDGNLVVNAKAAVEAQTILLGPDFKNATTLNGSRYSDVIMAGSGRDKISGGRGDDEIDGGAGRDVIRGKNGRDTLDGEGGNDRLSGGGGFDTFVFAGKFGKDVIVDFNETSNHEKIDLSGVAGIRNFRDLSRNHMEQDGDDVLISAGRNKISVQDVSIEDMNKGDFIF